MRSSSCFRWIRCGGAHACVRYMLQLSKMRTALSEKGRSGAWGTTRGCWWFPWRRQFVVPSPPVRTLSETPCPAMDTVYTTKFQGRALRRFRGWSLAAHIEATKSLSKGEPIALCWGASQPGAEPLSWDCRPACWHGAWDHENPLSPGWRWGGHSPSWFWSWNRPSERPAVPSIGSCSTRERSSPCLQVSLVKEAHPP